MYTEPEVIIMNQDKILYKQLFMMNNGIHFKLPTCQISLNKTYLDMDF